MSFYAVTQSAVSLTGNASGRFAVGRADANRAEVLAVYPSTVSAGDIKVFCIQGDPETGVSLKALAGTISYNADGGRLLLEIPPCARQILCELSGYTGSGTVTAVATFWNNNSGG